MSLISQLHLQTRLTASPSLIRSITLRLFDKYNVHCMPYLWTYNTHTNQPIRLTHCCMYAKLSHKCTNHTTLCISYTIDIYRRLDTDPLSTAAAAHLINMFAFMVCRCSLFMFVLKLFMRVSQQSRCGQLE